MSSKYYLENKQKYNAQSTKWWKENKEKHNLIQKKASLKRLYGITLEEYELRLKEQNNKCAICGIDQSETQTFHVDHDHKTRKNRKLLCNKCNIMLGMANDNIEILMSAVKYLKDYTDLDS